jgi:pimeloyl-ACP methyl ester carboxylesterase
MRGPSRTRTKFPAFTERIPSCAASWRASRPDKLEPLAKAGVPILHVCGSLDPWLDRETRVAEKNYKALGGSFTVIIREGEGHFATGPHDPKPVVDFIISRSSR